MPTISLHMRLIALAGLLLAAALVATTQLVLRDDAVADEPAPLPAPREASASGAPQAKATPQTKAAAKAETAPKVEPAAKSEPAAKTSAPAPKNAETATRRALPTDKLPPLLADALRRHDVVVAAIFTPNGAVDRLARAEAQAAAKAAGAGFVALNLLQKENGEPLATELGPLKAPSVLVYKRPAKLSVHLYGFADMTTVAQAAANARRA